MLRRINFRDFGGGTTSGGRRIRTGLLFRSGVLQKLNASDHRLITGLDIRYIVDFRSLEEQGKAPSFLPGREKVSLPCNIDRITRERLRPLFFKRHADEKIIDVIDGVYAEMVEMMAEPMARLFRLMLTEDAFPVLVHCRAGKDRTGFAVAIIQSFLGMEREPIIKEYLRSNEFMMPKISKALKRMRLFTVGLFPKGNLQAAFEVKERYLLTALNQVESRYGGVEGYLMSAGITRAELDQLKGLLLEP